MRRVSVVHIINKRRDELRKEFDGLLAQADSKFKELAAIRSKPWSIETSKEEEKVCRDYRKLTDDACLRQKGIDDLVNEMRMIIGK